MKVYSNPYTKKVYDLLVPLLGEFMAQGILKTQSNNLKKDEETLNSADGQKLADAIKKGVVIFIGTEAAEKVAKQIKNLM
jgi:hypothetical protein